MNTHIDRPLFNKFIPSYLLIIVSSLALVTWFSSYSLRESLLGREVQHMMRVHRALETDLQQLPNLQPLTNRISVLTAAHPNTRVDVYDKSGKAIYTADSAKEISTAELLVTPSPYMSAIIKVADKDMLEISSKHQSNGHTYVIRSQRPLNQFLFALTRFNLTILIGGSIVLVVTVLLGFAVSQRLESLLQKGREKEVLLSKLKKLEHVKQEFVANVSHELRTPITLIQGFVETLKDGAIDDKEDAHRFLDIIQTHSERLLSIIEDLLSLSRIEQDGGAGLQFDKAKLRPILSRAVNSCLPRANVNHIAIEINCDPDIEIVGNPPLLEQAFINLLMNAVKYTESNTVITLQVSRIENGYKCDIIDRGSGIPEEHIPMLFNRFYRIDKARSRQLGGTGLGLAIVKHIVQAHQGQVEVTSKVGVGSTFSIILSDNLKPSEEDEIA